MIPELGLICLIFALCFSLLSLCLPLCYKQLKDESSNLWIDAQAVFVLSAYAILSYLFVSSDFTVRYVAENSSKFLPWYYRLTAVWGAHEGSILLWVAIYNLWLCCFNRYAHAWHARDKNAILAVLSFIQSGLLGFIIITSDPFARYFENVLQDGQDLNPLLQDLGFLIHPPILYTGYVGFSIAFAVSLVGLIQKNFNWRWAAALRPWVQVAWIFLTLGIALGSWWAYRELGWGGFWFWDPVENASFMPWLSGTALLHSLLVSEKRKLFYHWSILLALITFSLSLLGTFLVRSGILISVHAFASDPARGRYILIFLSILVMGSFIAFAKNSTSLSKKPRFYAYSKESLLLLNNLILCVLLGTVLLGTLYPLAVQVLNLGKLSVGAPYFNAIFAPLLLPTLSLMSISASVKWRQDHWSLNWQALRIPVIFSGIFTLSLILLIAPKFLNVLLIIALSILLILSTVLAWYRAKAIVRKAQLSMTFAHIGFAITLLGICLNSLFSHSLELALSPGDTIHLSKGELHFIGLSKQTFSNYEALQGQFELIHHGKHHVYLKPERRYYPTRQQIMTDPAIHASFFKDIYISLGDALPNNHYAVRIYEKAFIRWIWFGAISMSLGLIMQRILKRFR